MNQPASQGIDLNSSFASADDVIAALESIPGINDDLDERTEARARMEREYQAGRR